MKVAIGADHAGFLLKEILRQALENLGHQVTDKGTFSRESVDYPDYAAAVAEAVSSGAAERGVLVCSTGVGMCIAANKVPGVRAALATSPEEVRLIRSHNDANVITFGASFIGESVAKELLSIFLGTEFDGGRHSRRLAKIEESERTHNTKLEETRR